MHSFQRQRTRELLEKKGVAQAIFASEASVKWLTGLSTPVQLGANPFAGGPPLIWYDSGLFTLIVLDGYAAGMETFSRQPDCRLQTYPGYTVTEPIAGAGGLAAALRQVLVHAHPLNGRIGVEVEALPAFLWGLLQKSGDVDATPIDHWLEPLRMIKTAEELDKLRQNFALTDEGQAAARQAVQEGKREIDVWTEIYTAVHRHLGQRVPLGNDCIVGHRQANVGGWPLDLVIQPGDSFIVDLSSMLHGYWSDSCATYYASEPSAKQKAMHRTVADALDFAVSLIRPGVVARDVDSQVRQFIAGAGYPVYAHHTGHGVGVTGHEAPRIVPYNDQILEEGMVIMLEPGIYFPGETAVRLEDAVLVTATGAERLTHHDKSLP